MTTPSPTPTDEQDIIAQIRRKIEPDVVRYQTKLGETVMGMNADTRLLVNAMHEIERLRSSSVSAEEMKQRCAVRVLASLHMPVVYAKALADEIRSFPIPSGEIGGTVRELVRAANDLIDADEDCDDQAYGEPDPKLIAGAIKRRDEAMRAIRPILSHPALAAVCIQDGKP